MSPITKKPTAAVDAREAALVYTIEAGLERLRAEMAGTRNAVELRGAEAKPLTGSNQQITTSPTRILGFAIHETSGLNPATVMLYDSATGDLIAPVSLTASESAREWWGPGGVAATTSLYAVVSGTVEGSIFVSGA